MKRGYAEFSLLVVNFHYLERGPFPFDGVHAHSKGVLADHVAALSRWGEPLDATMLRRSSEWSALPEKSWLLTFDDGLKEHYRVAAPLLEELGLTAMFFVCGLPLAHRRVLDVQKMHFARAHMPPAAYRDAFVSLVVEHGGPPFSDVEVGDRYPYDDPETRRFKTYANYVIPPELAAVAASSLFDRLFDEEQLHADLYMSPSELRELEANNFVIGAHTYAHRALARLAPDDLHGEFLQCRDVLQSVGLRDGGSAVSYPFGGKDAVDRGVVEAARAAGYEVGFTTQRQIRHSAGDMLRLGRFDANDLPAVLR